MVPLLIAQCSKGPTEPEPNPRPALTIQTDSALYTWTQQSYGHVVYTRSTLTNVSDDTLYTTLGDFYAGGLDQDPLFVAQHSDGFIEHRQTDGTWIEVEWRGVLTEGASIAKIVPSKQYTLDAPIYHAQAQPGVFRIRIHCYPSSDSVKVSPPMVGYSNSFTTQ